MRYLLPILAILCIFAGCKVKLAEEETADLSVTWTCVYRAGQALSCPGIAIGKVKGSISKVANDKLGTTDKAVASAIVSAVVGGGVGLALPPGVGLAISCVEVGGNGLCKLVKVANSEKIVVTPPMKRLISSRPLMKLSRRAAAGINKPAAGVRFIPGKYSLTVLGKIKNEADSYSSASNYEFN